MGRERHTYTRTGFVGLTFNPQTLACTCLIAFMCSFSFFLTRIVVSNLSPIMYIIHRKDRKHSDGTVSQNASIRSAQGSPRGTEHIYPNNFLVECEVTYPLYPVNLKKKNGHTLNIGESDGNSFRILYCITALVY